MPPPSVAACAAAPLPPLASGWMPLAHLKARSTRLAASVRNAGIRLGRPSRKIGACARRKPLPQADAEGPRRRRFHDRCQDVAAEYHLSPKETEIMILFAKGRSSARIQEELYLSRGTVTTHLRHIYQKMGVHSKQEFLDVVEGRRG